MANNLMRPLTSLGLDRRLPILVTLILIVLLAHTLALLTWKLLPSPLIEPIATSGPMGVVPKPTTRNTQIQQISQWHLFGDAAVAPPPPVKQEVAPDTRLNLKLKGVVASQNPQLASAMIADERNNEDTYFVGDPLPGDAVLREIHADRVILEYRGRLETLRLVDEESTGGRPGLARVPRPTPRLNVNPGVNIDSANLEPSQLLAQYRDALISDPQSLMDLIRATPVEDPESGLLKGFRISPGRDRRLLGRFGLRSGDVVTAVNGVALDNPIKGLEIMQQLTTADSVSLQVERRGEMLNMEFEIGQ